MDSTFSHGPTPPPPPFSFATVADFDAHIESSIPGFRQLVAMTVALASYYLEPGACVYDLGCSTGSLLERLNSHYRELDLELVGIDVERNLLGTAATPAPNLRFVEADLLGPELDLRPDTALVTSIFTLQFLPQGSRPGLLAQVYEALRTGGGFIVAEKIHQEAGLVQEQFCFAGYDFKRQAFTPDAILHKQHDLRHIMRPLPEPALVAQLRAAGFSQVVPFWQGLLFKAWLCIK